MTACNALNCALSRWLEGLYVDAVHYVIYESRWFYDLPQEVRDLYLRIPLTAYYEDVYGHPVRVFAVGRYGEKNERLGCYSYSLINGCLSTGVTPESHLTRVRGWSTETIRDITTSLPHPEIMLNKCGPMAVVATIHYNKQLKRKRRSSRKQ